MGFVDAGQLDPKVICSNSPLSHRQRRDLERFFRFYALCKGILNRIRGKSGVTQCTGWLDEEHKSS